MNQATSTMHDSSRPAWWDPTNTRAMLLCRISDRKQKDGVSLDAQQHEQEQYAKAVGLDVACVESFQESAEDSDLRRQFHAAIKKALAQKVRHVLFYVHDRAARNSTDWEMLEKLVRRGELVVHIVSGRNVIHEHSANAEFLSADFSILQAKAENRERASKTILGMKQRCRAGWYPSRLPHFYWAKVEVDERGRAKLRGSTVAGPSPEGLRLVRREMELHLQGHSLDRIRAVCIKEGLVPPELLPHYRRSTVDKHLKQDFYAAIRAPYDGYQSQFTWRGERYDAKHEPIFSADEWARLQASFGKKSTYRKLKHEGLFNQGPLTLTCAEPACGCRITYAPKTKASGKIYRYYRCADGRRVHHDAGERQVNVSEASILEGLAAALADIDISEHLARRIAQELSATHRHNRAERVRQAEVSAARLASSTNARTAWWTRSWRAPSMRPRWRASRHGCAQSGGPWRRNCASSTPRRTVCTS